MRRAPWIAAGLLGALAVLGGCPKKLTEQVVREVPIPCKEPPAPAPNVSVRDMVTVAVVKADDGTDRAVLAAAGFATVVGLDEEVGTERAVVSGIALDGVTVRMPDQSGWKVKMGSQIPRAGQRSEGPSTPPEPPPVPVEPAPEERKKLEELERWRTRIIEGITGGYGVPGDVFLALTVAMMEHGKPTVNEALDKLGWQPVGGLARARLTRVEVRDGTITVDGVAGSKRTYDALVARLRDSSPLVTDVKELFAGAEPGFGFKLHLYSPVIRASDVATKGPAAADRALPADVLERLGKASASLAKTKTMGGYDTDLRALASRAGLTVSAVTREDESIEEGYLGLVTFSVDAVGGSAALLQFLNDLRSNGIDRRPVVVDPLTVSGTRVLAYVRVPYVIAAADTRAAPVTPILPSLRSPRWEPARALPAGALRSAFE